MATTETSRFAILLLVGPGAAELSRLRRVLQSIFSHEPGIRDFILIDDTLTSTLPEDLPPRPEGVKITVLGHERQGTGVGILGGGCWGILQGLHYLASTEPGLQAVLKIDTDALVIRPFVEKLRDLLEREPLLGTAGVVNLNCDGSPRNWRPFSEVMLQLAKVFRLERSPLLKRRIVLWGRWQVLRKTIQRARSHGYLWGEHAQGGSYLVSGKLIKEMHRLGYLGHGKLWSDVYMCEDPMMGMYAAACGLRNIPYASEGQVFGSSHQGLPFPPAEMLRRGYSIIHSLKNDAVHSEQELVDFFAKSLPPTNDLVSQTGPSTA